MKPAHYSQVEKARLTSKVFVREYPQVENVEKSATNTYQRKYVQIDNVYEPNVVKRVEKLIECLI